MTEDQIVSVFFKNGCAAANYGIDVIVWFSSNKVCSWNDKICAMLLKSNQVVFGDCLDNNVISFDDLTPELIEEQINLVRKKEKLIKINKRLNDLEKDFVKV